MSDILNISIVRLKNLAADPSGATAGSLYYNTGSGLLRVYSGVSWGDVGASAPVTSVNTYTGAVVLTKSDVGLSNVDNTSDVNKPVSTATQTALNLKADIASPTFTGTVSGITKSMVGLGNVDNTSDVNKPVSTAQQSALDLKLNLSGGTMSGAIAMGNSKITGLANGTTNNDAVNYAQLQAAIGGLFWLNPALLINLINDTLSTPPVSPVTGDVYIAGASATGAWSGFDGYVFQWNGSSWTDVLSRAVAIGDRFGVSFESSTSGAGGLSGKDNQVGQITVATPGSIVYSFHVPVDQDAIFVNAPLAIHFGHSYTYSNASTSWIEFGGTSALNAGIGLTISGNLLSVNLGAGITQVPSDEVGIDLYSAAGLHLTADGTTDSTATGAQLSVKLDGTTLSKSSSGLKVAALGITNSEVATSAAIAVSKLAALTINRAITTDGSGFLAVSSTTATELGYVAGVTSAIQTQLGNKASTALDNLASTAFNVDIVPGGTTGTRSLGSSSKVLLDVFTLNVKSDGNDLVLNANAGSNPAQFISSSVKRGASSSRYIETAYIDSITLLGSQTAATVTSFTVPFATVDCMEISYRIKDGTSNATRVGVLLVCTDGTNASITDSNTETSDLGITWDAAISGSDLLVKYTSSANSKVMRADIKKFLL